MPHSLNCPNCAAPLQVRERQTVALCVYCGSSVKIEVDGSKPHSIEQRELTADVLRQINQLLLDGKRAEAVAIYRQQAGVTNDEAAEAIDNLAKQMTRRTMGQQPISNAGILILVVFSAVGIGALVWGITNNSWLVALLGAGWALLQGFAFFPAMRVRWFYETGEAAPAVVQKMIALGEIMVRGEKVSAVRLWLEVHPSGHTPFHLERNVIMRQHSLEQLAPGIVVEVKCKADRGKAIPTAPIKVLERGM